MYGEQMTVGRLKELLDQYEDELEVRLMSQPNWPFEYSVDGVIARSEFTEAGHKFVPDDDEEVGPEFCKECGDAEFSEQHEKDKKDCVFLTEGTQICYGHRAAWGGY